jgi:hypothetical protein
MAAPHWALLQRRVLDAQADACRRFFARYFDPVRRRAGVPQDVALGRYANQPTLAFPWCADAA